MDKNSYETYEYIPTNSENDTNQFFVVQDDGTFLINRQIQYVAQVQDVKDGVDNSQPCAVYDVTSQQFFVDVNNSAEMISVPENYILPAAEEANTLYNNSYLIQAVPDSTTDQIETENDQHTAAEAQDDVDVVNTIDKPTAGCTEIMLSDEQYKMLEEKGWVLLETNDKVFVLNELGLHDITNNQALIEQYKAENQESSNIQEDPLDPLTTEDVLTVKDENIVTDGTIDEQEKDLSVIDKDKSPLNNEQVPSEISEEQNLRNEGQDVPENPTEDTNQTPAQSVETQRSHIVRIKTKYRFKDIPEKVVLGKTANGKRLVARIVKRTYNNPIRNNIKQDPSKTVTKVVVKSDDNGVKLPPKTEFHQFVEALSKDAQSAEHFAAANEIVMLLLQIPAFQPSLTGRNVIVTRTKTDQDGKPQETNTVTGSIEPIEEKEDQWEFVHKPNLIERLNYELGQFMQKENKSSNKSKTMDEFSVLHVHVTEKNENGLQSVSITLKKRQIPHDPNRFDKETKKPPTLFACSSCASIFRHYPELLEHQEIHSLENKLTIDTEKIDQVMDTSYYIIKSRKGTQYACLQCSMRFNKITNCQRHVKTHQPKKIEESNQEQNPNEAKERIYQCSLCPSSYNYASTLTKHFTKFHVSQQVKKKVIKEVKNIHIMSSNC